MLRRRLTCQPLIRTLWHSLAARPVRPPLGNLTWTAAALWHLETPEGSGSEPPSLAARNLKSDFKLHPIRATTGVSSPLLVDTLQMALR